MANYEEDFTPMADGSETPVLDGPIIINSDLGIKLMNELLFTITRSENDGLLLFKEVMDTLVSLGIVEIEGRRFDIDDIMFGLCKK